MDLLRVERTGFLHAPSCGPSPAQARRSRERDGPGKSERTSSPGDDTVLRISCDKDIGRIMVQIFDPGSGKVIRQFPPEAVVAFLKRFRRVVPQFVDKTV